MKFLILIFAGLLSNQVMATETFTCVVQDCVRMAPTATKDECDYYNKFVLVKDEKNVPFSKGKIDYIGKTPNEFPLSQEGQWMENNYGYNFANLPKTEFQIAIAKNGKAVAIERNSTFEIDYNLLHLNCTSSK